MDKLFHKSSEHHAGIDVGTPVQLTKDHSEVGGHISAGSECIIESIIHFPTRYMIKDEYGKIWTVPIHSIRFIEEEIEKENEEGEADNGGE